jgi:choline dehydrogenase
MTPLGKGAIGARWLLRRDGLGATNHFEAGANIRSRAGIPYPDIQMHFLPLAISYDAGTIVDGHGMQVHVGTKRSKSRGWVRLRPQDPAAPPRVLFNYMSHEDDWVEMRAAVRLTREIFAQPAFASYCGPELSPGVACGTDAQIDDFLRAEAVTAHRPCGTCRMGSDARAVVAPDGKVQGLDRLRVIDSSVFPQATAGDLNGPTIMLAERMSDMLRGRTPLTADEAPILIAADWNQAQRSDAITRDLSSQPDEIEAALSTI